MTRPTLLFLALLLTACQAGTGANVAVRAVAPTVRPGVTPAPSASPLRITRAPDEPPPANGLRPFAPASRLPEPVASGVPTVPTVPGETPESRSGAWLVRLAPGAGAGPTLAALTGFTLTGELDLGGRVLLRLRPPAGLDEADVRAGLLAAPGVTMAAPEGLRHRQAYTFARPDAFLASQWSHRADRGNAVNAWPLVPPASQAKIVVAVLDTGLDVAHPEFAGRVVAPRNFTGEGADTDVKDADGHGTHVAGILAARGDNEIGVAGVAWGVKVMPVKVLGSLGGTDFDIVAGLLHAVRWRPFPDDGSRVRVVNMSLGSPGTSVQAIYTDAVAEAIAAGVLVVAASGNDGTPSVESPANAPGMLAVGSSNTYLGWEDVSPFTCGGDRLDLVAPGEEILSTVPVAGSAAGAGYAYLSGTSMACPYVAGVAALVTARYDADNADANGAFTERVRGRLMKAVTDLGVPGRDPYFGEGRIDAGRAVAPGTIEAAP